MELHRDTLRDRYRSLGYDPYPITFDKNILDQSFPRLFISHLYGGDTQSTSPNIGKAKLAQHGLNDFMYANLLYQPHAPEVPGAPGLFFGGGSLDPWPGVHRLSSRIASGQWQYQGQYVLLPDQPLSRAEWLALDVKVYSSLGSE